MYWIWIYLISIVIAHRELYDSKCKRTCNTEEGSLSCWKQTTDGFAYGLSTTMIDFCQTILKARHVGNESWYNITRQILSKQIEQYEIGDEGVKQLTKVDIEQIAVTLLDQCFNASSSILPSEPSCPSCSAYQTKRINHWRLSSIILLSIGLFLVFIILLLYAGQTYYVRRSYTFIG